MSDSHRATGEDLKRAILVEARGVLEAEGYAALSTRRIASAVGCTATSIYLYYSSKDALVHALIEEGFAELNERLLAALHGSAPLADRLRKAARAYVEFGLERTPYYEIMFMLRSDQMERFPAEGYRRARTGLDALAAAATTSPEVGVRVGTLVWAALHGLVALLIAERIDVSLNRETLIEDLIHGAIDTALADFASHGSPPG